MLNAALGVGIGLLVSWGTKKITEAAQRVQNVATQSKEAADAAQSATSSLKDLVNAYEELGDKSGWDTDDFDQAKDIQAEILDLAKEQGTLDEDKLSKLNLQNGKYEEQLGLLQDITAEQLEASRYELTQNKDAQGDKLVDTAKKNNRTHYLTVWSAPEMDMGDQIKNAGIDVFNKFGGYGPDDLNDADSIIDYYNEVGKALKYVIDHTTEAERAAGGTYHSLYQFLLDEQSALRDDVDSYNDSTDAINNNTNARRKLQAIDFWSDGKSNGMDVSYSFDKVNSAIETLKNTIDDFDASKLNDLLWGTNEGLTDEQAQALAALRKALTDMDFSADTDGVNAFIQALVQVGIVAQSSANGVDALAAGAQKMEDISSKMDEIQSAYKASTSAMEEYNQYGYMSLDSLQSLLTMNTEYLNCLELVNGKLQINKQSYAELLAAEYAEAAATILSNAQHEVANLTADDTAESTDGLKEKTEAEKTALENLLPALKNATAATATYSAAQEFANEVEKAGERGVDPAKLEEITNRTNTQLSLLYTNMNAALKGGQALTNQLNGFGSSSKNAGKSSSATSKSVADLSSAFDTLTKAMKEYNQYGYISADTIKSLIGVDDKFTACLTEQNGKLELNTAKFRTFVRAQLEEANAANDGGKSAGEMKKILDWLNSSVDSETISFEQLTDAIKGYGTAMDEAKEKTDAIKSAFSGLYDIQQKIKNSQFGVGDLDATESKIESILQLSKFFGDNKDLMDNLVDKNGNINLNTEAFKQATLKELDKRIEAANQTGGAAATALANSLSSDKANIESGKISVSDYLVGLGTDLERVNTELDKYQTNWSTLKDAMDEWNTTGQLTQDTMQKLQELPEEFSNLLTYDEDGNAKIDVKALRQSYVDKLSAFAKEFEGSPIGIQVQAMIDDVREPTQEEYKALAKKTATYQKVLAQYTKKMSAIDSNKDLSEDEALQQKAEVQKELDDALEKALLEVQETDAQVTIKLKKHWDGVEKVIEEFKSALSDAKAVLSSFLSLLSTLNDKSNNDLKIWGDTMNKVIDKRIKALNKQKEALEENNDATERAIELSGAQDALARAEQQRTTRVYTENGYEWQANRFARLDVNKGAWVDKSITFLISQDYSGGGYGICRLVYRSNADSGSASVDAQWLVRRGFSADTIQVAIKTDKTNGAYCDAFYKSSGTYMGVVIRAIASGGRATSGRTWTLVDSNEVGGTTATDKKTSSECWKTIADAGTALHKQAYSASAPAKDEGYVASAGSANTSSSCAGNSASATKLTSSAGSATQPVYFKDGKPVAGTYTLGDASSKTVRTLGAVGNTGWANKTTDDKYIPTMSFMAYWNGAYSGTSSNLQYCDRGRFGTIVTKGSGDYAAAGHTHNYAGSGSAGGSANSAVKLDSNAGSSVQPVYFSGGKPVAIGYTISSSVPANAKFTDTTYGVASSSSNGLMSSTDKTKLDDFSRVISIQKQIKLTTDWLDTGIAGNSLDTGTYVVQVSGFNSSYTQLYSEIYSGVMSWYSGTTNSGNSSEIFLHNAGLADNNNAIYLRTLRVAGSKTLKLQIACKVAATGTDILTFKFRRLI